MSGPYPITGQQHPWMALLGNLVGLTGVPHGYGIEDEAKAIAPSRIVWTPKRVRFEVCRFTNTLRQIDGLIAVDHAVAIYGGSALEVIQRANVVCGALDLLAGPEEGFCGFGSNPPRPGYKVQGDSSEIEGGTATAPSWKLQLLVTLKDFTTSFEYGTATAEHVITSVTANGISPTSSGSVTWALP